MPPRQRKLPTDDEISRFLGGVRGSPTAVSDAAWRLPATMNYGCVLYPGHKPRWGGNVVLVPWHEFVSVGIRAYRSRSPVDVTPWFEEFGAAGLAAVTSWKVVYKDGMPQSYRFHLREWREGDNA